mmetsp:Transcript_4863/g.20660  ORF Transcript_4863/g.20660 Transcript_4863/m.20660 type:complete len:301 (+) Transcript_4863:232-1134(+)
MVGPRDGDGVALGALRRVHERVPLGLSPERVLPRRARRRRGRAPRLERIYIFRRERQSARLEKPGVRLSRRRAVRLLLVARRRSVNDFTFRGRKRTARIKVESGGRDGLFLRRGLTPGRGIVLSAFHHRLESAQRARIRSRRGSRRRRRRRRRRAGEPAEHAQRVQRAYVRESGPRDTSTEPGEARAPAEPAGVRRRGGAVAESAERYVRRRDGRRRRRGRGRAPARGRNGPSRGFRSGWQSRRTRERRGRELGGLAGPRSGEPPRGVGGALAERLRRRRERRRDSEARRGEARRARERG